MNKYGAKKTEILFRGLLVTFDSKAEAMRAKQLELLERGGYIQDLRIQPAFVLIPSFKRNGKTVAAGMYVADFEYIQDGKHIIEDLKGFKTATYNFKRKLFLSTLDADIVFRETTHTRNGHFEAKDY